MTNKITRYAVESFMTNINKLGSKSLKAHDPVLGTVTFIHSAEKTGSRKFSVSSKVIRPGAYTLGGMRRAYMAVAK